MSFWTFIKALVKAIILANRASLAHAYEELTPALPSKYKYRERRMHATVYTDRTMCTSKKTDSIMTMTIEQWHKSSTLRFFLNLLG